MSAKRKTKAQGLMMGVKALEDSIRIAQEQARLLTQDYQARKDECLKELAERIRQGETTGDEIADFLAVNPNHISSEPFFGGQSYAYLKELSDLIGKTCTEPILIIEETFTTGDFKQYLFSGGNGRSGFAPPPRFEVWKYKVAFGILKRTSLDYSYRQLAMYAPCRVCGSVNSGNSDIQKISIASDSRDAALALPPLRELLRTKLFPEQNPRNYVIAGRTNTNKWLDDCHDTRLSRLIREKLAEWQAV